MKPVATLADILEIEARDWPDDTADGTYGLIRRSAMRNPDAPALSFFLKAESYRDAETWTYRDLLQTITQTANALHRLGLRKDDVVSVVLPNLPETHFTIWGGQASGIVAPFNPLLEAPALATLLAAARTKVLVTLAPFPGIDLWSRLQPELAKIDTLEHLVQVDLADRMPSPHQAAPRQMQEREAAGQYGREGLASAVPPHVQVHDFWRIVEKQPSDRLLGGRQISPDDRSSYFCTGGTTGLPKIAVRRHGNEVANAQSVGRFIGDSIGPGKTLFCGLPLFHVNGVLVTGLLPFSRGAHVVLGTPGGYRGEGVVAHFWEIVEHYKVNFFSGVPTLFASLMQVPVSDCDIRSLEYGLCGAAPMPVEVFRGFQERTGLKLLEGYGLTEATCVSSVNPPMGERRIGSIGLRLPGQLMKAVALDERGDYVRDCRIDEVGVLAISGPNVFCGYLSEQHENGLWLDCGDGRQWLNTGDLGRQDAEGYFWLTGRKKDLIIRGGHNIDPITIEEPLAHHPDVQFVAAIGRPDAYAGEVPVAFVQLRPGSVTTEAELSAFARAKISERAAIPKFIRIVDEMPLTSVGKISKPTLKHREIQESITEMLKEVGLSAISVKVMDVPSQGITVVAVLENAMDAEAARAVLGSFSYPFTVHTV